MSDKDTGGFAFPVHGSMGEVAWEGMTLRDYFAAKAMAAMIAQYPCQAIDDEDGGRSIDNAALAVDAYSIAEEMLEARK
jgi:hypothetical protein